MRHHHIMKAYPRIISSRHHIHQGCPARFGAPSVSFEVPLNSIGMPLGVLWVPLRGILGSMCCVVFCCGQGGVGHSKLRCASGSPWCPPWGFCGVPGVFLGLRSGVGGVLGGARPLAAGRLCGCGRAGQSLIIISLHSWTTCPHVGWGVPVRR